MRYVEVPNLPENRVKLALVDGRISNSLEKGLIDKGIQIIKTKAHSSLHASVSFHPDMFFHHIGGESIVYAPGTSDSMLNELKEYGFNLIRGETELNPKYPGDISYNAARIGQYAFHNTRYTDKILKDIFLKMDVEMIHISQGYAKCAISIVDENSIITMDKGIAKVAEKKGFDVLVIEEKGILLEGLDYGFIGGSTGLIDRSKWAVCGNFGKLKSSFEICEYLRRKDIEVISLADLQVVDIGSLVPVLEYCE